VWLKVIEGSFLGGARAVRAFSFSFSAKELLKRAPELADIFKTKSKYE
jgi:hypothetical protein